MPTASPTASPTATTGSAPARAVQLDLDGLGTPLRDATFVVVDLETTGGSHLTEAITEIGAVKVRGGEVLGELATLVDPGRGVPPLITVLTGITDAMLVGAPPPGEVVASFLELAHGCVLVAHNAPFDVGFLRAAAGRAGLGWPAFPVLDTARLARRVLTRDEAPDCKLSTLARVLRARTTPVHRALADARATVDVLHTLIERVGALGITTVEDLRAFSAEVPEAVRRKRHLADALPHAPGVYVFRDSSGRALYVGTSRDVRSRVRRYFTASEPRTRMAEMVGLAERIDVVPCATALEAEVRELRLIAAEAPPYNRRSRTPARVSWLALTDEPYPRLALVRRPRGEGPWIGPFHRRASAEAATAALHEAIPLRQCSGRLARGARAACALAGLGRCGAPCEGTESRREYAVHVARARAALSGDPRPVLDAALLRISRLVEQQRYEEAATHRDRAATFIRAAAGAQALCAVTRIGEVVAARRTADGGWELHLVHSGRLDGAALAPPGAAVQPYLDALVATAGPPPSPAPGPAPAALVEETRCILRWLRGAPGDGVPAARLVRVSEPWASPAAGAGGLLASLPTAAREVDPTRGRRPQRTASRPARRGIRAPDG